MAAPAPVAPQRWRYTPARTAKRSEKPWVFPLAAFLRILVSSAVAFASVLYTANYAAAKAYTASLGQALHYELKAAGVVLTLTPGPVRTEGAEAAEGIDFAKLPVPSMQPAPVVRAALRGLGRKPLVIPGQFNKASDFAGKYLTPRRAQTAMFGALISRARRNLMTRGGRLGP